MNGTDAYDLFDRLLCGGHGTGIIEWRGRNMLIVSYGEELDEADPETVEPSGSGGRHRIIAPAENIEERFPAAPPTVSEREEAMPVTRDAVLEALRRRAGERLRRRHGHGDGEIAKGVPR